MPQLHEIAQQGKEGRKLGQGETTVEALAMLCHKRGAITYFGNRLCPYAHRAYWALLEKGLKEGKDFDYIHIDLGKNKPDWYQKSVNPYGTVPALYVDGKPIFESSIICEAIEELYAQQGAALMPADPVERAAVRLLVSHFNERTIPPLYRCLKAQTPAAVKIEKEVILVEMLALESIYTKQAPSGYFLGGDRFSLAEVMIIPFLERMCVALGHYRGLDPLFDAALPRLQAAFTAARKRPALQATTQPTEFYVAVYDHYANPLPSIAEVALTGAPATSPSKCPATGEEEGGRPLGWRVAAFLRCATAAVPVVAVPTVLSAGFFLVGCAAGWSAARGRGRYGGHIR